jgi:hypothetical protein
MKYEIELAMMGIDNCWLAFHAIICLSFVRSESWITLITLDHNIAFSITLTHDMVIGV